MDLDKPFGPFRWLYFLIVLVLLYEKVKYEPLLFVLLRVLKKLIFHFVHVFFTWNTFETSSKNDILKYYKIINNNIHTLGNNWGRFQILLHRYLKNVERFLQMDCALAKQFIMYAYTYIHINTRSGGASFVIYIYVILFCLDSRLITQNACRVATIM